MTLVEKVARAIAVHFSASKAPVMEGHFAKLTPHQKRECEAATKAAIAIVLEEAAVEALKFRIPGHAVATPAIEAAAAAIRALGNSDE